MNLLIVPVLLIISAYVIMISLWLHRWQKLPSFQPAEYAYVPVSIVVAFRNEANNLQRLTNDLIKQKYPAHLFEVILVDDFSDDNSAEMAVEMIRGISNFRCITGRGQPGKKGALKTGIEAAGNELIIITDADAHVSPLWLAVTSTFYSLQKPSLIIAPVNTDSGNSMIRRFFIADFISLIAAGAGAAANGRPVICNGANMAFRKSAFLKIKDAMKSSVPSGDDTFILHAMKRNGEKILYLKTIPALVEVKTPPNIREFMNQHIRWASKSRYYKDRDTVFATWIVFLVNFAILAALILMISGSNSRICAGLILIKVLADYRILDSFHSYLDKKFRLSDFVVFSLIYPFYLVLTAVMSFFAGYSWKGRRY